MISNQSLSQRDAARQIAAITHAVANGACKYKNKHCVPTLQQMMWSYNDATLLTCGSDSAVYEWDVREGKRCREFLQKGARLFSVSGTKDGATVYAACQITEAGEDNVKETRCKFFSAASSKSLASRD